MKIVRWGFCLMLLVMPVVPAMAENAVVIGVLASRGKQAAIEQWQPLANYLQTQVTERQFKVETFDFDEIDSVVDRRQVDILIINDTKYIQLKSRTGNLTPIVSIVAEYKNKPLNAFGGVIISRADRKGLDTIESLRGKRIAVVSKSSLGGFQAQMYEALHRGVDLRRETEFLSFDNHEHVVNAVIEGRVDAGFIRSAILEAMQQQGRIKADSLQVINRQNLPGFPLDVSTHLYPEWPVLAMPQLEPDLLAKIAASLLMASEEHSLMLRIGIHGFTIPYSYESVIDLLKALALPPFDSPPAVTFGEIWRDHRAVVATLLAAFVSLMALLGVVLYNARRLRWLHATMQKQANRSSIESTHLRTLLDTLPDLVWLKNKQGVFLTCNAKFSRLCGASEQEIVGKTDYDFVPEQIAEFFIANDEAAILAEQPSINQEWLEFKSDGYKGLFETIKTPMSDAEGNLIGVLGIARDITSFHHAQKALHKRMQELYCLYEVYRLTENTATPIDSFLQALVECLPEGMQYPEVCVAAIDYQTQHYCSATNLSPVWRLQADFQIDVNLVGHIKVGYTSECPDADEGPFLKEERSLIEAVARRIEDFVKRQLLEKDRQYQQTLIQSIFSQAAESIVLIDPANLRFVEFNDTAAFTLGYSRDEFAQLNLRDIQGDTPKEQIEEWMKTIADSGAADFENTHRHKDGSILHMSIRNRQVNIGDRSYWIAAWHNITPLKDLMKTISDEAERLHVLMNSSMDGIHIIDTSGKLIEASRRFSEMIGYSFDELLDLKVWDWDLSQTPTQVSRDLDHLQPGDTLMVSSRHRRKDGSIYDAEIAVTCVLWQNERQFFCAARDISERIINQRMAEKEANLRKQVMESIPGMFYVIDSQRRFIYWNSNMEKLSRYSSEEVAVLHPLDLFGADDKARVQAEINKVFEQGSGSVEAFLVAKDGNRTPYFWTGDRIELDGQPLLIGIGTDITERLQAELEITESETRFRKLFEQTGEALFLMSGGIIIDCNQSSQALFGYEREQMIGSSPIDLSPKYQSDGSLSIKKAGELIAKAITDGGCEFEWDHLHANGKLMHCQILLTRIYHREQNLLHVVCRDISQLKLTLQALSDERRRFEEIIDATHAGTWEWNIQTGRCVFNERWAEMFGYKLEELAPFNIETWASFCHPEDYEKSNQLLEEHFAGKRSHYECEVRMRHRDGHWIWIADRGRVVSRTADGKPLKMSGSHIDITERKQAEEIIKANEEQNRLLLESASSGIVGVNSQGRVTFANPAAASMLGYSRQALLGQNLHKLIHGVKVDESSAEFEACPMVASYTKGERSTSVEEVFCRADGSSFSAEYSTHPIYKAGLLSGSVVIFYDVTEKKLVSEQLRQYQHRLEELVEVRTQEMERAVKVAENANKAKSDFLANMSHEIRTPMNAILGMTHLMKRSILEPVQLDRLGKIDVSAKHLLGVINDILDLSKIEADQMTLDEGPFNLMACIDHAISMTRERANDKRLRIQAECDPRFKVQNLLGDSLRIGQILVNLLSNAIKFTTHGAINIRAICQEELVESIKIRIEVEDTGIGMTQEQQQRVFDAFVQAEDTTTRQYGGTGLGLAISRRLVHLMGGFIGVSSEVGKGSTFWINVQLKRCNDDLVVTPSERFEFEYQAKILLVEDNQINQEIAKEILEGAGLQVDVANDGLEALNRVKTTAYDLVLMDMQMPVMDGLEATRQIRLLPGKGDIPILAMTANAFADDRENCFRAGMNDFVSKPVDPDRLLSTLARWITRQTAHASAADISEDNTSTPDQEILELDTATGIRNFAGKEKSYYRLLSRFAEFHNDDPQKIRDELQASSPVNARRIAHSLKGAAATLGAVQVCAYASDLELNIKQGKEYVDLLDLISALEKSIHSLSKIIAKKSMDDSEAKPIDSDALSVEKMKNLQRLLSEGDIASVESWQGLRHCFSKVMEASLFNTLDQQMKTFDFMGALELLREFENTLLVINDQKK